MDNSPLLPLAGLRARITPADLNGMFVLFSLIIPIVLTTVDRIIGFRALELLYALAVLLPSLGVTVRRLHDTDRSGWWILISLVPLAGFIVMLVFTVSDGTPGPNKYGANPKEDPAHA